MILTSNYPNNIYSQNVPNQILSYLYIGFTFNKLAGTDGNTYILNFAEIQLYGKEYNYMYSTNGIGNSGGTSVNKFGSNILTSGGGGGIGTVVYNAVTTSAGKGGDGLIIISWW